MSSPAGGEGSAAAAEGAGGGDACWQRLTAEATRLVSPSVGKLLPLVLGSRQYAAKLAMVAQLAAQLHPGQQSCCFVALGGATLTDPAQLPAALATAATAAAKSAEGEHVEAEQLFPFDHVYPTAATAAAAADGSSNSSSGKPPAVPAVLYGSPGLACFSPLHAALKAAAEAGGVTYVFRPLLQPHCESAAGCAAAGAGGPLLLPGWGCEAALKNTEYSALDDKGKKEAADKGSDAGAEDALGAGEGAVVRGFRLDVLAARKPALRQELLTLRDQLLTAAEDEADGSGSLKVWDIADVGLAAAQRVLGSSDPLALLAEVSQNFPGLVSSLSRQPVNASLRSAVAANQAAGLSAGANFMLLNGLAVDVNSLDYFGFLGRLRAEMRLRDALVSPPAPAPAAADATAAAAAAATATATAAGGLGLPGDVASAVMALRAEEGSAAGGGGGAGGAEAETRLSLGSASTMDKHVTWLNNLDKDAKYQRFGRSVNELLSVYPGRLKPLGRNIFTAVLVAQPLCAASLELAAAVEQMWQGGYPIRFGVVFELPAVAGRLATSRRYPHLAGATQAPAWEDMDASERFGRAFATLREAFGGPAAWRLWSKVAELVGSGEAADPGSAVETAFKAAWAAAARSPPPGARAKAAARKAAGDALTMLQEGSGYAAEVGLALTDTAAWLLGRGLVAPAPAGQVAAAGEDAEDCSQAPLVWMNGLSGRSAGRGGGGGGLMGGGGGPAEDLLYKLMGEMQRMQEWVYFGRLADDTAGGDVLQAVLGLAGAVERLNPRLVGPAAARSAKVLPLAPLLRGPARQQLTALWRDSPAAAGASAAADDDDDAEEGGAKAGKKGGKKGAAAAAADKKAKRLHVPAVTHVVAADLCGDGNEGRELVAEALRFLADGPTSAARDARLLMAPNPGQPQQPPCLLEALAGGALAQLGGGRASRPQVLSFLRKLLSDGPLVSRLAGPLAAGSAEEATVAARLAEDAGLDSKALLGGLVALADAALLPGGRGLKPSSAIPQLDGRGRLAAALTGGLGLAPGEAAVVTNGRLTRVYRPGGEHHELVAEDFPLLHMATAGVATAVSAALARAHAAAPLPGVPPYPAASDDAAAAAATTDALSDLTAATAAALAAAAAAAPEAPAAAAAAAGAQQQLGPAASKQLQTVLSQLRKSKSAVEVPGSGGAGSSGLRLEVILNPLSRPAQRLSGLLLALRQALGAELLLALNPQRDLTEMPLKSYYRYALPQGLAPAAAAASAPGTPAAHFARLPPRRVLTLNMEAPESWLLEPAAAAHDLDNLRLEDVPGETAYAEFELDSLMLTGSCVDVTASGRLTPPRGLQLHLGTPAAPHLVDTLVMANLAYFQLKAAPGLWLLSLAPGRSRELYELTASTGTSLYDDDEESEGGGGGGEEEPKEEEGAGAKAVAKAGGGGGGGVGVSDPGVSTQVLISSFTGKHMILRVRKRPGMEDEDVLKQGGEEEEDVIEIDPPMPELEEDEYADEDDEAPAAKKPPGSLLGRVSDMIMGKGGKDAAAAKKPLPGGDVINVFTVASGHMYERLQKIMILSVVRHTKSKVKFWIIKNYCSPQHRAVLPALAAAYGFEYEFVTYKWPTWLHKQTDKQRLIWAYKILFLDVLFPLGVERIIFVDSDQVVRTDLAELYHMDIRGAPYAYTPFCDNNRETDEYRFWKGGFWRDHLQGKPYHISALYLVDLKRFRQLAAGDQLRVVYDQLSKDPNSLANLDQDLPNYAQHNIKIFSLPQEWLWCESWCGNSTKHKAKTIDLCNNPKTKEPKLTAARRIIGPLWEELDGQQEAVTREVQARLEAAESGLPLLTGAAEAAVEAEAAGAGAGAGAGPEEDWAVGDAPQQRDGTAAGGADRTEL
ncbi:hypothetical protein HXX76_014236 [Chlamydomonas incerta]|uniref:UDP-glucose:glycoprotein glucosyltransferase n=1 Tax=Chlamydomonas incerta TaxID=51695 RepID=A0A835SQ83_CHLIN|nr:hypothetical protein HXX76_014236 [Chlamydomonas incerta]|eukprot:KAG2424815.1 hypothetical protein HXX76_014236 [Chlamydomonas incerta]